MDAFSIIFSFIFGAIVGSFLNVVSLRFNSGVGIGGRSKCMSCGKTLTWKELIPLLSFVVQRGSCKKCKSKISWQYPLVEFVAGAIFVLIFLKFPPLTPTASLTTLIYVISTCLLIVMAAYDIKHKIIPDNFVYVFDAIALVGIFVGGASWFHVPSLSAILAGPIIALPFALIWLFSRGAWMGLGDAKLVLGLSWLLGLSGGINAVILAFWIAAAISIMWILVAFKRFKPKMEIPFGPYLILGMYLVLIFGIQVMDVSLLKNVILWYL